MVTIMSDDDLVQPQNIAKFEMNYSSTVITDWNVRHLSCGYLLFPDFLPNDVI